MIGCSRFPNWEHARVSQLEMTMSNKLKLAFLAVLVAIGITSPVLAKRPDGRHARR